MIRPVVNTNNCNKKKNIRKYQRNMHNASNTFTARNVYHKHKHNTNTITSPVKESGVV